MDRESFDSAIMTYINRRPYQPFTVELVNGRQMQIDHPNAISMREGMALFLTPGRIPHFFDHEGVCRIIGELAENSPE